MHTSHADLMSIRLLFLTISSVELGPPAEVRDFPGKSHHFIVGITKSAPERIPVGQRVVMVFKRV
jgi:hypothetical protein